MKGFKPSSKCDPLGPQPASAPAERSDNSWRRGSGGRLGNYSGRRERRRRLMERRKSTVKAPCVAVEERSAE